MGTRLANFSRGISDAFRADHDSASKAEQVLANVALLPNRARERSEFNDPRQYLKIFRCLLTSRIPPHWGRPTGPDSAGLTPRQDAWKWLYRYVRGKTDNSDLRHMDVFDGARRIFVEAIKERAFCEYPLYIPPQWRETWFRVTKQWSSDL